METLIEISNILIIGLILAMPILLLKYLKKQKIKRILIYYFLIGILFLGLMICFSAWWYYESNLMLLKLYGYNIEGMNETEFYGKVLPENMQKVKNLETSVMGIGWPLKAIFGFIMVTPYLGIVYILNRFVEQFRKIKNEA